MFGEGAFYGCTGLTSITIPDSVTRIGESAFSGCTRLAQRNSNTGAAKDGQVAFACLSFAIDHDLAA